MKKNRIRIERRIHKKNTVICLIFDSDMELISQIRQGSNARWSRTMNCWWIPDTPESIEVLTEMGINDIMIGRDVNTAIGKQSKIHRNEQKDLLIRFSNYMKERRYSPRTIEGYTECLRIFFDFLNWKDILEIDNQDVNDFNRNYILARKLSATYQSQFVSAIKLFFEKIPRKRLSVEQIERPRRGRPLPKVMSPKDVAQIIGCTANLKHRAMLSLLYSCGLRRNELLDMRITDIDSKRNVVNVRHAKGDKDRQVPLSPKILELLREYFKKYHPVTWLFEGEKPNTPYTGESLHRVFVAAKQRAGVGGRFTLHCLRHSYATHLMEAGVNLRYIQELLGHRHIKTTEIYLHVSSESMCKIQSPFDTLEL